MKHGPLTPNMNETCPSHPKYEWSMSPLPPSHVSHIMTHTHTYLALRIVLTLFHPLHIHRDSPHTQLSPPHTQEEARGGSMIQVARSQPHTYPDPLHIHTPWPPSHTQTLAPITCTHPDPHHIHTHTHTHTGGGKMGVNMGWLWLVGSIKL